MDAGVVARRLLDPSEKLLYLCDRVSPFNFVFILNISGDFSDDDCRAAIDWLQCEHPLLRVHIPPSALKDLEFVIDPSTKIPFKSCDDDISSLQAHIENELCKPMDTASGPLIRFNRIRHRMRISTLLMVMHHSIGDGESGCLLSADFMRLLSGGGPEAARWELPAPIDAGLPNIVGWWRHAATGMRMVQSLLKNGAPVKYVQREADLSQRTPIVCLKKIGGGRVQDILASCRAHACSVQGALGAALLLAVKQHLLSDADAARLHQKKPITLQLLSPVDIRKVLEPPIQNDLGLYVATQASNHRMTADKDFWRLASEIARELHVSIDRAAPITFMPIASKYLTKIIEVGGRIFGIKEITQWLCGTFPACIGLSNMGGVGIVGDYDHISLNGLSYAASLSATGAVTSFALTYAGQLSWNFVGMSPSINRRYLQAIADSAVAYLLAATDSVNAKSADNFPETARLYNR
ncbi:MAG: hypothetical protein JWM78_3770 [Verrucomicrobiaceae bacterium]|nr:hypothetical protein [Verrucomicrobiaceae bacterium]